MSVEAAIFRALALTDNEEVRSITIAWTAGSETTVSAEIRDGSTTTTRERTLGQDTTRESR